MPVIVKFKNQLAWVEDYKWHCSDKYLESLLTGTLDFGGPSVANGNYDVYAARVAKEQLGVEIVDISVWDEDPNAII